jgi:hypothetical protein
LRLRLRLRLRITHNLSQSNTKKTIYPKPCGGVPLSGGQGVRERGQVHHRLHRLTQIINYQLSIEVKVENYPQIGQSNTKKTIYSKPCGGVPLSGGQGVRERGQVHHRLHRIQLSIINDQLSIEAKVEVENLPHKDTEDQRDKRRKSEACRDARTCVLPTPTP